MVNHELSTEQLSVLQGLCAEVLVRGNKGSDFGAYKDAVLHLTRANKGVSRLLLLNDSVYVFPRGLKKLVAELLADDYPVVAAYECWERLYHFQSFCIGLSGSVVYDHRIQDFWEHYRPLSIRRWRIDHGEVALSAVLRNVASRFKVIYGITELLDLADCGKRLDFHPEIIASSFREQYATNFRMMRSCRCCNVPIPVSVSSYIAG